jgi:hypothetical protein
MLPRIIVMVLAVVMWCGALPRPCAACSCATATVVSGTQTEGRVVRGVVTEVDAQGPGMDGRFTFRVSMVWNGDPEPTVTIVSRGQGTCGPWFNLGEEYLVFADERTPGVLTTDACNGNTWPGGKEWDVRLAALGAGIPVGTDAPAQATFAPATPVATAEAASDSAITPAADSARLAWLLAAVLLSAGVAGGLVVLARRGWGAH